METIGSELEPLVTSWTRVGANVLFVTSYEYDHLLPVVVECNAEALTNFVDPHTPLGARVVLDDGGATLRGVKPPIPAGQHVVVTLVRDDRPPIERLAAGIRALVHECIATDRLWRDGTLLELWNRPTLPLAPEEPPGEGEDDEREDR